MRDLNIIRAWNGVTLPPEADERIRHALEQAMNEKEHRMTRVSRLRSAQRRFYRTVAAAVVVGSLLTVAAIAVAAARLPTASARRGGTALTAVSSTMPPLSMLRPADSPRETWSPEMRTDGPAETPCATEPPQPLEASEAEKGADAEDRPDAQETAQAPEQDQPKGHWEEVDGKRYYTDADGNRLSRWQQIDGDWYYFDMFDGSAMKTGWLTYGRTHYMDPDGRMATGWRQIDGQWYYFWEDGTQAGGWQQIDGSWYYFDEHDNAPMVTGWIEHSFRSGTYYTDDSGRIVTGRQFIDGKWYDFGEDGRLIAERGPNGLWYSGPEIVGWDPPDASPNPDQAGTQTSDNKQPDPNTEEMHTGLDLPADIPESNAEVMPSGGDTAPGEDSAPDEEVPEQ